MMFEALSRFTGRRRSLFSEFAMPEDSEAGNLHGKIVLTERSCLVRRPLDEQRCEVNERPFAASRSELGVKPFRRILTTYPD